MKLLLYRAELAPDGSRGARRCGTRRRGSSTEKLERTARATSLYEEILDPEPTDAPAATALRGSTARRGATGISRGCSCGSSTWPTAQSERASLGSSSRSSRARSSSAPDDAIETLRAILDEEPAHTEAVLTLSQLYEKTGRDAELAELFKRSSTARASAATSRPS